MKKPCVHLICNAHLDPVWQWRWEEGCAEALATFRNAVTLLDEHPGLIFNQNEAILYRWVERYDPALFERIRELVSAGRWFISGGWHLQPDANLPGLESFFRHIQEGRRYFLDRFGRQPRVAYNFDSFGHHGGLPQILRRFGYEMYIHMRPQQEEMDLPSDLYRWRGVDGSEIPTLRIAVGLYHTERDNIEERLEAGAAMALKLGRDVPVFWGLGNHGGGPTRMDLEKIDAFIQREERVAVIHSTTDRLYEALRDGAANAPLKEGDLQRSFTGCYTSLARIKARARRSLARLVQAEALCTAAWWSKGSPYPARELEEAWRDHLFNDFHDILPGTCTEPAEQDALDLYGRAAEEVRRIRFAAAAAFNRGIDRGADLPVTVLNSNPALTRAPVEVEFMADYRPFEENRRMRVLTLDGEEIPSQEEKPEALLPFNDWRRKVCFMADLPGLGAARFRLEASPEKEDHDQNGRAVDLDIDSRSGLVTQIRTPEGKPCLDGPLFKPLVVDDPGDAWGTGHGRYRDTLAAFQPEERLTRVIRKGPVRTITESVHVCGYARLVMQVITFSCWPVIEVRMRLSWFEQRKRLKLAVPTCFRGGDLVCEIPGGALSRSEDGEEHVHGRWLMIRAMGGKEAPALGIVNSGQHGFDFFDGEIRLSVLRSAAYCHERGLDLSGRERKYMDQGIHQVRLLACAGKPDELMERLPGLADWLDAPPLAYAHLPVGMSGGAAAPDTLGEEFPTFDDLLSLSHPGLRVTAVKRSEDGEAMILRVHEAAGRPKSAKIQGLRQGTEISIAFKPFEIKTLRMERSGGWKEVDPSRER